jgi:uncharacterized protein (DUF427 family)
MGETASGETNVESCPKRVRVVFANRVIADSLDVRMIWEHPHYPQYYFPVDDVDGAALAETDHTTTDPERGTASHFTVRVGDREAVNAAWQYRNSPHEALRGLVRFDWAAMDRWYEEGEEVFVHARNPYARIDVLESDRHVQVEIDGITVADSTRPRLLFETRLPTRYYLPHDDVRMDLLAAGDTTTRCPYKGVASYWTARIDGVDHADIVWSYPTPILEVSKVTGLLCFYNEKVDLIVDGQRLPRAVTGFG